MTETEKERIYREAFEEINKVCDTQEHVDNDLLRFFITKKMMDIENLPVSTDKLSVENLQARCDRYEKALTEIASPNMIGAARIPLYRKIASEALAEIGGESESLDN